MKKGWPNSYNRLKEEFEQDRLFATKEDLKYFKGDLKTQLMVADFYYEIEQWEKAAYRYRKIDRVYGDKLNTVARAYLDMILGHSAQHEKKYDLAVSYFSKFEERQYENTPSWERVMLVLFTYYQNDQKTHGKALACLKAVEKKFKGKLQGWRAYYHQGEFHFAWKNFTEAKKIFNDVQSRCDINWLLRGSSQYLDLIHKTMKGENL